MERNCEQVSNNLSRSCRTMANCERSSSRSFTASDSPVASACVDACISWRGRDRHDDDDDDEDDDDDGDGDDGDGGLDRSS